MASSSYDRMRSAFTEALKTSMKGSDVDSIQELFNSFPEPECERRNALDQAFREMVLVVVGEPALAVFESLVARCVSACRRQLATPTVPVVVLSDLFDCLTLDRCERLFTFVETNVAVWKEELFFNACKNNLLRMCNDLLRRLSRSQNTVFCGRILLFLAKFFPFSERSGLNIVSEFNVENVTEFSGDNFMDISDTDDIKNETSDEATEKIKIDYNLYSKFWSLQNFFRNPLLVYSKVQWKTFVSHTDNVLSAFKSFKLEGVQNKKSVPAEQMLTESAANELYFAKFLTNQKLLELQLCDVNFRRYVLVQYLILFQYLNATVKFKSDTQELKGLEAEWVEQTTQTVNDLLRETPPDGATFQQTVQHILKREEFWNNWKNEGCPELRKSVAALEDLSDEDAVRSATSARPQKRPRKRLGQMIKDGHAHKKFIMGNPELTRLWNFMPDNLEACRAPERNFLMSLDEYFKEAIEQLDPAAMVEDQYKVVNDGNFGWRALRLLVLQSSHFFTHSNNAINKLPEYLETMIKKIAKERPIMSVSGEMKNESLAPGGGGEGVAGGGGEGEGEGEGNHGNGNVLDNEPDEEDELLKTSDEKKSDEMSNTEDRPETPEPKHKPAAICGATLDIVAQTIAPQWKDFAAKMDFKDTVQYVEESKSSDVARARYMLELWAEEDVNPSPIRLAQLLKEAGFEDMSQQVSLLANNS